MNSCNYCSKTYALSSSLKRHIKHAHQDLVNRSKEPEMIDSSVKAPESVEPSTMEQHEVPSPAIPPVRESKLIKIGDRKFVSIRKYCGKPRVNIRQYIRDSHGKPYATQRGILLTSSEWGQLKTQIKDIDSSLKERCT